MKGREAPGAGKAPALPVLALVFNAFVWGVSWWPLRFLQSEGLHPLWATALVFTLAVAVIGARWPRAFGMVRRTPELWLLMLAAGATNAAFNWGVSIGDVVRVVLLFYLMPIWTVLLARLLLKERLNRWAALRMALALAGAAIVLMPPGTGWPWPSSLADLLGIAGGFFFALTTVLLRRESHRPHEARAVAMFTGSALVGGALAALLGAAGSLPLPPAPQAVWVAMLLALTAALLAANLALQYGAARLRANVSAVVMLTEVVFAAASAVWLGDQVLSAQLLLGGALIVAAALLAALEPAAPP